MFLLLLELTTENICLLVEHFLLIFIRFRIRRNTSFSKRNVPPVADFPRTNETKQSFPKGEDVPVASVVDLKLCKLLL